MKRIILIAHNLRSCHNVGSLMRTAEGLGAAEIILTGNTPYPVSAKDTRIPHESRKIHNRIAKTALGAEKYAKWTYTKDISAVIDKLRAGGCAVFAVEQTADAIPLPEFKPPAKLAMIVGREVEGIEKDIIDSCDGSLEIPMKGKKESFNVVQAAAMALYHCTFN